MSVSETESHTFTTYCQSPAEINENGRQDAHEANMGRKIASHLNDDIRPTVFAEVQLLLLTFCTGIQGTSWPKIELRR